MTIELNITQGEWRASSGGAHQYVTAGGTDIAKVYEQVDPKTAVYNGQLMAMAPKLYKALDELCRAAGSNSLSDFILAKARAVDVLEALRESCAASEPVLTASPAFGPDGAALGKPLRQLLDDKFKSIDQDLKEVSSTNDLKSRILGVLHDHCSKELVQSFVNDGILAELTAAPGVDAGGLLSDLDAEFQTQMGIQIIDLSLLQLIEHIASQPKVLHNNGGR